MDHKRIATTKEVWQAIMSAHKDLVVFSSYSAPDGETMGDQNICVMMTEYGFRDGDHPVIGAETRWEKPEDGSFKRINEQHYYWLCVAKIDNDE